MNYTVTYTKKNGQIGTIEVTARNEKEAIANAKNQHYTGKDFRDAKSK
jgi:hypothetical protein